MRVTGVALALIVGCGPSARAPVGRDRDTAVDAPARASRAAELRSTLARIGVALDTEPVIRSCGGGDPAWCYRCDVASVERELSAEQIHRVERAIARYPEPMIAAARLKHVALCQTIRTGARGAEGDPWGSPTGLALADQQRIMVSIEPETVWHGLLGNNTIERGIHHELFHLFDRYDLGAMVTADAEWQDANPIDFVYGAATDGERPYGFVSLYAATNAVEDRASVFEHLMEEPTELCELVATDPVIAAKTAIVWKRVARVAGTGLLPHGAPCSGWVGWTDTSPSR